MNIEDVVAKAQKEMVYLKFTTFIDEDALRLPPWLIIKGNYEKAGVCPVRRALSTILNSIITQNRIVFGLTRDNLKKMMKEDKNLKKKTFNNNSYTLFLKSLEGWCEIDKANDLAWKFIVKDKDILSYLCASFETQNFEFLELTKPDEIIEEIKSGLESRPESRPRREENRKMKGKEPETNQKDISNFPPGPSSVATTAEVSFTVEKLLAQYWPISSRPSWTEARDLLLANLYKCSNKDDASWLVPDHFFRGKLTKEARDFKTICQQQVEETLLALGPKIDLDKPQTASVIDLEKDLAKRTMQEFSNRKNEPKKETAFLKKSGDELLEEIASSEENSLFSELMGKN